MEGEFLKFCQAIKIILFTSEFIETKHNLSTKYLAKMYGFDYIKARNEIGLKWHLLQVSLESLLSLEFWK